MYPPSANIVRCNAVVTMKQVGYCGGSMGDKLVNPKTLQGRAVIDLSTAYSESRNDASVRRVLGDLGFQPDGLDKIYNYLGKGNLDEGKKIFFELIQDRKITIERVGFSKAKGDGKPVAAKFCLMINEKKDEGGNNQFHIGFSRRGTPRAVLRNPRDLYDVPELAEKLSRKDAFADHIPKGHSRIMNAEPGIKVCQLGQSNLGDFNLRNLSKQERFDLYMSIFEGLNVIHKVGVHQDVKPGNIVVNAENRAMFIDLDTMAKEGQIIEGSVGTTIYYSPERLEARYHSYHSDQQFFLARSKDDVWGVMLSICELEASLPAEERLLSDPFIRRYQEYTGTLKAVDERNMKNRLKFLEKRGTNLFSSLKRNPKYPLDALVYETAHIKRENRYSATAVLMNFSGLEVSRQ